ncbi:energy transducer TonB [Lysobacter soli]|uniref:energy transducer TonB n=1 Tax=Lysobacter soli TaxID=453783 RepID=UPI00209D8D3E|nr:energy transducer TonB [Lysobacter soli]UTA53756.1 energy transducer TonB [Lysobacter soli]
MAHAIHFPAKANESLDGGRIAASTGTLLINGALLLALLVPISQRVLDAPRPEDDAITIVQLPKLMPIPPPVVVEPVEITRKPPMPTTRPSPQTHPVVAQIEQPVADAQPGDIAIDAADIAVDEGTTTVEPATSSSIAQLQALRAPPPTYPAEAMRAGLSGTVELEILVGIDGRALDVRIVRSSGHRVLDQAARRTVLSKWTFVPAMRDGRAVEALGRLPIEFKL